MRTIFEAADAEVNWDETAQKVTATKGRFKVELTVGNNAVYKDGVAMSLDVAPSLINTVTMVPLRFIAESLGYNVFWRPESWMVVLEKTPTDPQKISNGEIIVDCSTEGYQQLGTDWTNNVTKNPNHDGSATSTCQYVGLTEPYTPKIIYTPQITESGMYDIYVYQFQVKNADSAVGFEIVYDTDVTLDPELPVQNWQEGKSGWVKLTEETGPLFFSEQTERGSQHVIVKRTKTIKKEYTRGTAVKFVKVK